MSKIELSVAIIFKNEIRCLERCLQSIQPLRERLSVQIVMADTGSTDGSRAIAERYADILFDFPWINDFAAARNAVLERCTGAWTLVMDCDEWLNTELDEFVKLLRTGESNRYDLCYITIRNYQKADFSRYGDFSGARLLRMASKPHYVGAIHEYPEFDRPLKSRTQLQYVLLHHDGYVMLNEEDSELGNAKRRRNLALLKKELEAEPNNLRRAVQYAESANGTEEFIPAIHHALELVEGKAQDWEQHGPQIYRLAVFEANRMNLPEFDEWTKRAQELFPESFFTRIDIAFILFARANRDDAYEAMLPLGEAYLRARRDYAVSKNGWEDRRQSSFQRNDPYWEQFVRLRLAQAYQYCDHSARALELMEQTEWTVLDKSNILFMLRLSALMYLDTELDFAPLISAFWEGIGVSVPSAAQAEERRQAFLAEGASYFDAKVTMNGEAMLQKAPCDLFLPLAGKCILGDAAALMRANTPEAADDILDSVDDAAQLPAPAFVHALKVGAEFPLPAKPLTVEQIAACAKKMLVDPPFLREAAKFAAQAAQSEQEVLWAYALAKIALEASLPGQ